MTLNTGFLRLMWVAFVFNSVGAYAATNMNASDFNISAYSDTSYNYLLNNHQFINGSNNRTNDLTQNGFTLQQIGLTLAKQPKVGFGGLFNVVVGRDVYSLAPNGWNPYYGSQTLGMFVPQAFLQYAGGPFTFAVGMFEAMIGYENFDPNLDANFSRSILDGYAEPGIFIGAHLFYDMTDKVRWAFGVNNGWAGLRDHGHGKCVEAGVLYNVNPALMFNLQITSGPERLTTNMDTGPTGWRNMVNLVGTVSVNDKLSFALSIDDGQQSKALKPNGEISGVSWQGFSAYSSYIFTDKWKGTARAEWYGDLDGYTTGLRQNWREMTVTLSYLIRKNLEVRGETRRDFSNKRVFMSATGAGVSPNQQSAGLEVIYNFI